MVVRGYIAEHPNDEEEVEGIDLHQQHYPWEGSDMDYLYDEVSISLDGLRSIFESRRFEITKLAMCQDSKNISADDVAARAGAGGVSSPLSRLLCSRSSLLSLSRYACSSRFEFASPVEASVARRRYKIGVALSPELRGGSKGSCHGGFGGGLQLRETRVEGGCDRGESVRYDFFVRVFSGSPRVVTASLDEFKSLTHHRHITPRGSRGSFAASESASSRSSHPGAVVIGLVPSTVMAEAECLLVLGCGQSVGGALFELALVAFARHCYSGNVKGIPGIRGNAENLTFTRVTLMVENGYRYRRISKNILADCVGFSGWAKLGL
ncbi:hypothetical protein YC2023_102771 [Brassica napus]